MIQNRSKSPRLTVLLVISHDVIYCEISDMNYCNALFYNLPEYLLHKLTKVLYSALRFTFGLHGSALHMHRLQYATIIKKPLFFTS